MVIDFLFRNGYGQAYVAPQNGGNFVYQYQGMVPQFQQISVVPQQPTQFVMPPTAPMAMMFSMDKKGRKSDKKNGDKKSVKHKNNKT